jgi:hypothetical protein
MRKTLSVALLCAALQTAGAVADPSAAPSATALPEIYHSYSSPLCSALRTRIAPSLAMISQNDVTIAKSDPLFKRYIQDTTGGDTDKASRDMGVVRLSNLVRPLVDNILATQKLLEDPTIFPNNPKTDDEKRLADLKAKTFEALAAQQAALDIINGFVQTQELAGMQHDGFGYIGAITGTGLTAQASVPNPGNIGGPTPDPFGRPSAFDDTALNAGLTPNPYEYNLPNVPGLALGYNPIGRLYEGVQWTQSEGAKSEAKLAKAVIDNANLCGAQTPSASPKP